MTGLNDRDRRDLQGVVSYYRFRMWVGAALMGAFGLVAAVRGVWGILRYVIPGGV